MPHKLIEELIVRYNRGALVQPLSYRWYLQYFVYWGASVDEAHTLRWEALFVYGFTSGDSHWTTSMHYSGSDFSEITQKEFK